MPELAEFARLPLDVIVIQREDRQRTEIDVSDLLDSIRTRGVFTPILVKREGLVLVAGERRIVASRKLGLLDIPVRFTDEVDPIELQIIELEENIKRMDLGWKDQTTAIHRIHSLFLERDGGWTLEETGQAIGMQKGQISVYLKVFPELDNPRVAVATNIREAYNVLGRRDSRLAGEALTDILNVTNQIVPIAEPQTMPLELAGVSLGQAPSRPAASAPADSGRENSTIQNVSFLDWAPKYAGRKFNLVHCDFPYGINVFSGPQAGGEKDASYSDTQEDYVKLLECFCLNLDKFMATSAHLMFWYSAKRRQETEAIFQRLAPSITFYPYDLIWLKSDNAGIAADHRRQPRHIYEQCMFGSRGGRQVVQIVGDAVAASTDKRWHISTKPEGMLRHFFTMLVDESTSLLDPTCGSGSAIRAAEGLNAARTLGLEVNAEHCENARMALRQARSLRRASEAM